MEPSVVSVLDSIKSVAMTLAIVAFVVINGGAVIALLSTRSRSLVQKWTSPWLAANLLLLGVGAGVPIIAGIAKSVVQAVAPSMAAATPAPPIN